MARERELGIEERNHRSNEIMLWTITLQIGSAHLVCGMLFDIKTRYKQFLIEIHLKKSKQNNNNKIIWKKATTTQYLMIEIVVFTNF